jgi:hypothetical protein
MLDYSFYWRACDVVVSVCISATSHELISFCLLYEADANIQTRLHIHKHHGSFSSTKALRDTANTHTPKHRHACISRSLSTCLGTLSSLF